MGDLLRHFHKRESKHPGSQKNDCPIYQSRYQALLHGRRPRDDFIIVINARLFGLQQPGDAAVANAVKAGFGDAKGPLTRLAQEVLVGDAPKSDKSAKSNGTTGGAPASGNASGTPPPPPLAPPGKTPPAPNGALASDD